MRYKVIESSVSGHCCFEATVIDTSEVEAGLAHSCVCECFTLEDAQKVCNALNSAQKESICDTTQM